MRGGACAPCSRCWLRRTFPDYRCRVPQLFANAKERSSVCSLQAGISLCHFLQQLWSKCPGAPFAAPIHAAGLPRFRASLRKSSSAFTSYCRYPLAPSGPVWEERGGRRRFKPISSELVRHMRTGVHFSRFATPEMLCAWLGPYTHAMRSRRSGRSCQRSPWAMATGLVDAVDAPVNCQADRFWPPMSASVKPRRTECVYCPVPASCMAGCFRQAAHDRSIQADERAVIPILQVCSATTCVCSCRRGHKSQGYIRTSRIWIFHEPHL